MWNRNVIALTAIVEYEVKRVIRVWAQTLLPPAITMTLYFLIFGKFIGSQLNDIHGQSYMKFIVPGLIMMSMVMNAYSGTVFAFFVSKFNKSIEEILVAPVPNVIILLGFTIGGALRGLCVGVIVSIISLCFTHFVPHNIFIIMLAALLASVFFSLAGFTNAVFARRFDDISIIPTFVLTPLIYLGGVFYSIQQLPPFWRHLSLLNPVLYIVEVFRYGFLGIKDINIVFGIIMLCFFVVLIFFYNMYLLNKGVNTKA